MFKIKDAWQIVEAPPADEGTWVDARDGQVYTWKKLGNQTWMTINFNYGGKSGDWVNTPNAQSEGHAWRYQNQQDYGNYEAQGWTFGAYYTLASLEWAVPDGWHVPTRDEINTLKTWAMETYGSGASGNVTAQMLGNAALMNSCSSLWSSYGLKVPANKHNLTGFNLCINSTGWSGSGWGYISTPGGYNFTNTSNLWLADSNGSSQYYLIISEDSQYSYSGPNISFSSETPGSKAHPIRLIKDAEVSTTQPIITNITTSLDSTGSDNKIATEKATRTAITNATSSKMSNPMTAAGDLIVGGTSGAPSRLSVGSPGKILKVGTNGITWDDEAVVSISDTDSIGLTIDQNGDLTADLKIDSSSGNVSLTAGSDGLYGEVEFPVAALDSGSPGILVSGNVNNEYTVGLALSSESDNILQLKDTGNEGLYAPPSELDGLITTAGDLIVGGASGVPSRLASGTQGQVLKVGSSGLEWGNESSGMQNPMTTSGDIIVGGNSGAPGRLGQGIYGQVLKVGASGLEWGNEIGFENPMTSRGDLIVGTSGGVPDRLGPGNDGQILTSRYDSGVYYLQWATIPTQTGDHKILVTATDTEANYLASKLTPGSNITITTNTDSDGKQTIEIASTASGMINPMTSAGDIIVGGNSGTPARLAIGTQGQVLKVGASGLEWGNESSGMQNPMTTSGDIIVGGNSGTPSRLAQGTLGQVLKVGSNGPEWGTDEGMLNPMTSSNDLIIGGTSGAPNRLGAGSDRQILTVNGGTVMWENPLYALNADNPNDTYMFYTQFEDTNTRAGGGYENKLKTLGMNSASVGNILSLRAGTPVQSGMVPQNEPYWRTESDVFQSGHPMTAFGDIIYAGSTDSQGRRSALSLPAGTVGQVLGLEEISTFGMKPKWVDLPGTCQENFNICLSTKKENLTSNPNKLYAAKFISHETAKRTKLGFYHCTGIQGIVMMGVYDKLGNLIGQTGPCSFATEPDEEMLWYDVETPFTVTAGEEYWFVFWGGTAQGEYNMSLTVLQHDITQNFDPYIVGSISYTSSKTTLPSTIPSLQYETTLCYMAVK